VSQVGLGRDHTLFALRDGRVQFTRIARPPLEPQSGRKWVKKPWKKYVNVLSPNKNPILTLIS